jgi:type 1 glutamine amidotransferase
MVRRFLPFLISISTFGQNVLHYTETSGFDHDTRDVSLSMFEAIAAEHGLVVTSDNDGSSFSSLATLQQFDAVIFSNTSGDDLLDAMQRTNFEAYIAGGGNVMGIHAVTDTYRHSTANGSNTGTWDFYAELIGASVQNEEYYYWEGGYYRDDNNPVLQVEQTVGPNGEVNSYDAPRPMSWYRELQEGGRVFYTALGHASENYTDDVLFRQHIENALLWLIDDDSGTGQSASNPATPLVWPNPVWDHIRLASSGTGPIRILDATGRTVIRSLVRMIDVSSLAEGLYYVHAEKPSINATFIIQR